MTTDEPRQSLWNRFWSKGIMEQFSILTVFMMFAAMLLIAIASGQVKVYAVVAVFVVLAGIMHILHIRKMRKLDEYFDRTQAELQQKNQSSGGSKV